MSITETQFTSFVLQTRPPRAVEDVTSLLQETKRQPDPYVTEIIDGRLFTPDGEPLEKYVLRESALQRAEACAFDAIQDWSKDAKIGEAAVWFSPPHPTYADEDGISPSKFIMSKVISANLRRALFHRAVVLDIDANGLSSLAQKLDPSIYDNDPETLRTTPVFVSGEIVEQWLNELRSHVEQADAIAENSDIAQKLFTYGVLINHSLLRPQDQTYSKLEEYARRNDLMGNHRDSCRIDFKDKSSAFGVLMQSAKKEDRFGPLSFECPKCGQENKRPVGKLLTNCQHCGGNVRC